MLLNIIPSLPFEWSYFFIVVIELFFPSVTNKIPVKFPNNIKSIILIFHFLYDGFEIENPHLYDKVSISAIRSDKYGSLTWFVRKRLFVYTCIAPCFFLTRTFHDAYFS